MLFDVFKMNQTGKEQCLKGTYSGDIVEYLTGESPSDNLPAIMSEKASTIYNGMRLMKKGDTFEHENYLIVCVK